MSESVAVQMKELLDEYSKEVKDVTEREINNVAKDAVQKLRNTSPKQAGGKHPGRYARGWRVKKNGADVVVYNATDYQLTHLLEFGHAVANQYGSTGARARAIPHIAPVEQWANEELPVRILRGLK